MLSWGSMVTALGEVSLAASEHGLCRVRFGPADAAWLAQLRSIWQEDVLPDQGRLTEAIQQLCQYLAGERHVFDLPLDLSRGTAFQQSAWRAIIAIPYGQTYSYGQVAEMIDNPRATRAVGGALGRNPVPVIVPCHRVVAADGSLGGFSIGLPLKRALLRIEGNPLGAEGACAIRLPGLREP